jgi:hypothetical protein
LYHLFFESDYAKSVEETGCKNKTLIGLKYSQSLMSISLRTPPLSDRLMSAECENACASALREKGCGRYRDADLSMGHGFTSVGVHMPYGVGRATRTRPGRPAVGTITSAWVYAGESHHHRADDTT